MRFSSGRRSRSASAALPQMVWAPRRFPASQPWPSTALSPSPRRISRPAIVAEPDRAPAGAQGDRPPGRVVLPGADRSGGGTAARPAPGAVVTDLQDPAVADLRRDPAEGVTPEPQVGIGVDGMDEAACGVVTERHDRVAGPLLDDVPEDVARVGRDLAHAVGPLGQPPGRVEGVGQLPAVEVGLANRPCRVIGVAPGQVRRAGDRRQPQLRVVGEREPGAVRPGTCGAAVEVRDLVPGGLAEGVDVLDEVALGVVAPVLGRPAGPCPRRRPALGGPAETEARWRVDDLGDPAERVADVPRGAARRVRDRDRQPGGVRRDPHGSRRVRHRGQMAAAVVVVGTGRPGGIDRPYEVPARVVGVPPRRSVGVGDPRGVAAGVVLGR